MDPDLVRQQEEAEAASRARRPLAAGSRTPQPPIQPPPQPDAPFLLRADPRDHLVASPPSAPPQFLGWGAALRVTTSAFALTSLGLVAGILLGVKLGLISWQSFAIGAAAGLLLGWQSAFSSLRRRYKLGFASALRVPIIPIVIILVALIAGMAVAAFRLGLPASVLADYSQGSYWLNAGLVALIGFVFAVLRMRKALRPAPVAAA
jgi:hypothetical protein